MVNERLGGLGSVALGMQSANTPSVELAAEFCGESNSYAGSLHMIKRPILNAVLLSSLFAIACGGGLNPGGGESVAYSFEESSLPITCSLAVAPSYVKFPGSTLFQISASPEEPLPAGAFSVWNGTKDGAVDAVDQPTYRSWVTGNFPIDYTDPNLAGNYVRYAVIKDATGKTLCTTNSVSVVFERTRVTCSLSTSERTVPQGGSTTLTITASGTVAGDAAFWWGTRDGAPDASGTPSFPLVASGSFMIRNSPGFAGKYKRYAVIRDKMGLEVCKTNEVEVTFQ